jgi:hypothetical protein
MAKNLSTPGNGGADGASRAARQARAAKRRLLTDLGASPTQSQLVLLDHIGRMQLRLYLFDEQIARGERMGHAEEQTYASLASCVARSINNLTTLNNKKKSKPVAEPIKVLDSIVSNIALAKVKRSA